jgi:hypothetical protein
MVPLLSLKHIKSCLAKGMGKYHVAVTVQQKDICSSDPMGKCAEVRYGAMHARLSGRGTLFTVFSLFYRVLKRPLMGGEGMQTEPKCQLLRGVATLG